MMYADKPGIHISEVKQHTIAQFVITPYVLSQAFTPAYDDNTIEAVKGVLRKIAQENGGQRRSNKMPDKITVHDYSIAIPCQKKNFATLSQEIMARLEKDPVAHKVNREIKDQHDPNMKTEGLAGHALGLLKTALKSIGIGR